MGWRKQRVTNLVRSAWHRLRIFNFYLLLSLWKMWPVSIVIGIFVTCFFLSNPASEETVEAMLGYVKPGDATKIVWLRYVITLLLTVTLGTVLRNCARRLLNTGSPQVPTCYAAWLGQLVGHLPLAAIAIGFFSLSTGRLALSNSFELMAAGLLVSNFVMALVNVPSRWLYPVDPLRGIWKYSSATGLSWLVFAVVLAAFAFSERDRTLFLPFSLISGSQNLGPVNIILAVCCLWTAILTSLVMVSRTSPIPVFRILALAIFITNVFGLNDNHAIRRSQGASGSDEVESALTGWLEYRPDKDEFKPYPVILVSAGGGGIRAAFFTAITLARMVDACPRVAHHIFAITGVSGGAVGASVFAAAMKARPPNVADDHCDLLNPPSHFYEDAVSEVLSDDHLSPLLIRLLMGDAFQQVIPMPIESFDRQLGLEFSLERSFRRVFGNDGLSEPLYQLVPTQKDPSIPYVFLNATRVEDGMLMTLSPLYFKSKSMGGRDDWHAQDYLNGPPISAAAGTSARFPLISPPGYFVSRDVTEGVVDGKNVWVPKPNFVGEKHRYVDGGYSDDSSAPTLLEIYNMLSEVREEGFGRKFFVNVLHIASSPTCDDRENPTIHELCGSRHTVSNRSGILSDLWSSVLSMVNVFNGRSNYELKRLADEVERRQSSHSDIGMTDFSGTEDEIAARANALLKESIAKHPEMNDGHFKIQLHDRGVPVPLGWLLSSRAASELRSQIDAKVEDKVCESGKQTNGCQLLAVLSSLKSKEAPIAAH